MERILAFQCHNLRPGTLTDFLFNKPKTILAGFVTFSIFINFLLFFGESGCLSQVCILETEIGFSTNKFDCSD